MKTEKIIAVVLSSIALLACGPSGTGDQPAAATDPLPSWNEGQAKQSILDFVDRVTDPANPDFVPEPPCHRSSGRRPG